FRRRRHQPSRPPLVKNTAILSELPEAGRRNRDHSAWRRIGSKLWPREELCPEGTRHLPKPISLLTIEICPKHVMAIPLLPTGCRRGSIQLLTPRSILSSPGGICRRRPDCLPFE